VSALELKNWLPVETKVGKGYAFLIETHEADNWYTVILDSRAIVTVRQQDILMQRDYSHQRGITHDMMREIIKRAIDGANTRGQGQGEGQGGPIFVKE
jgi:hypothetical protein